MIKKEGKLWVIRSEKDPEKVLGSYKSKSEAVTRLRQIEGHKADSLMRYDSLGKISVVAGAESPREDGQGWEAYETPEGFLRVTGYFTRTGTFKYSDGTSQWGEYRPEEEVFHPETIKSFGLMIVTDDHPGCLIDVNNVDEFKKGHCGDAIVREGDRVKGTILITNADLIQKIKEGKCELSVGYEIEPDRTPGIDPDGNPYDLIQREIRGNHLAVVEFGRAGPTCRIVMDSGDAILLVSEVPNMKKTNKDMDEMEALRTENEALKAKLEEQAAKLAELGAEEPSASMSSGEMPMDEEMMAAKEEMAKEEPAPKADRKDALQAQIDMLKAKLDEATSMSSAKIDARVALVSKAREVLGANCKTDGLSDSQIKKAIVAAITPSMKSKLDGASDSYVDGAYAIALDTRQVQLDNAFFNTASQAFHSDAKDNVFDIDSAVRKRYGK